MELSKEALIKKLEAISVLYSRALAIKDKMNSFEPNDNYERKVDVPEFPLEVNNEYDEGVLDVLVDGLDHTADDAVEYMSRCYDKAYQPEKPAEFKKPKYEGGNTGESRAKQSKFRNISNIGLGVAIFFLIGAVVGTSDTPEALPTILIIALLGAAAFVGGRFLAKKEKAVEDQIEVEARAEYNKEIANLEAEYKNKIKLYEDECNTYISVREAFLKKYADWRKIYLDSVREESEIEEKLENDRQEAVEKIKAEEFMPVFNDLTELNDILTNEYLPAADIIIDLLKSGRADDLKEAINLYEDILYRERQLQLEREKEAQRQHEEAMKREAEERFQKEQIAMQKEQLAMQAEQAKKQLEFEEQKHRDEMKMQADQLKQQEAQFKANRQKRCVWCAHKSTCREQYYEGAYNCTGFTPKS